MKTLRDFFALAFLCWSLSTQAQDQPWVLATYLIPNLVVEQNNQSYGGHFYHLAERIIKDARLSIQIQVLPPKRVIEMFVQDKSIIGFFPGTEGITKSPVHSTRSFAKKKDFIFFRKGTRYHDKKDLYGKTVGLTRGYPYQQEVVNDPKINWSYNVSDESNFKKLAEGRLDFFLCEEVTADHALQLSGVKDQIARSPTPLSVQDGFFFFQRTQEGKKLATIFSDHIDRLIRDGIWNPVLQQYKEK